MNKLIRAGLKRVFRIKTIYLCLAVLFLNDGFDIMKESLFPEPGRSIPDPEGYLMSAFLTMILLTAVFITSFLGSEYQYGTLRNKIAVGHERWQLYVGSFVVCYSAVLIMYVFVWGVTAVFGTLFLRGFKSDIKELAATGLVSFLAFTMLTALFVLVGLCIQSKSAGSVAAVILAFLCMITGVMTVQILSAPQFIPADSIPAQFISEYKPVPEDPTLLINPDYVEGSRRKMFEMVHKLCPASQMLTAEEGIDAERVLIPITETVVLFAAGMLVFQKRDLK